MRVAVLGLGEAGSIIAPDLARAGDEVQGSPPPRFPHLEAYSITPGPTWPWADASWYWR
ncbi:MAG: hypothetical protein ACRDWS_09130 [Acidimicrobiia bacterium]